MIQKFGICICHNKHNPINSRGLCPEGARERHEHSAAMKNMVVKKKRNEKEIEKEDEFDSSRGVFKVTSRREAKSFRQDDNGVEVELSGDDFESTWPSIQKAQQASSFALKKAYINPCSEKKKLEDAELDKIKKQKIAELGKKCEMCNKPGEVDLFHIIGRGDKKYSTDPTNLLLSCRWCHNVWTANDWGKIIKFKNFQEIMDRLKSLNEGYYWKLKHKIDEYLQKNKKE